MALKPKKAAKKKGPSLIQRSRSVSPASKAAWNHGPGGKKVYRKFFGLSTTEQGDLEAFVGRRIEVNLHSSTV